MSKRGASEPVSADQVGGALHDGYKQSLLQQTVEELEQTKLKLLLNIKDLQGKLDQQKEDQQDIYFYLNKKCDDSYEIISNLEEQILTEQAGREKAEREYEKKIEDLNAELRQQKNSYESVIEEMRIEMEILQQFAKEKDDIEKRLEKLLYTLEEERKQYSKNVNDVENRMIYNKEKMKRELEDRLRLAKRELKEKYEQKLPEKAINALKASQASKAELKYQTRQVKALLQFNQITEQRDKQLAVDLSLARHTEEEMIRKFAILQRMMKQLNERKAEDERLYKTTLEAKEKVIDELRIRVQQLSCAMEESTESLHAGDVGTDLWDEAWALFVRAYSSLGASSAPNESMESDDGASVTSVTSTSLRSVGSASKVRSVATASSRAQKQRRRDTHRRRRRKKLTQKEGALFIQILKMVVEEMSRDSHVDTGLQLQSPAELNLIDERGGLVLPDINMSKDFEAIAETKGGKSKPEPSSISLGKPTARITPETSASTGGTPARPEYDAKPATALDTRMDTPLTARSRSSLLFTAGAFGGAFGSNSVTPIAENLSAMLRESSSAYLNLQQPYQSHISDRDYMINESLPETANAAAPRYFKSVASQTEEWSLQAAVGDTGSLQRGRAMTGKNMKIDRLNDNYSTQSSAASRSTVKVPYDHVVEEESMSLLSMSVPDSAQDELETKFSIGDDNSSLGTASSTKISITSQSVGMSGGGSSAMADSAKGSAMNSGTQFTPALYGNWNSKRSSPNASAAARRIVREKVGFREKHPPKANLLRLGSSLQVEGGGQLRAPSNKPSKKALRFKTVDGRKFKRLEDYDGTKGADIVKAAAGDGDSGSDTEAKLAAGTQIAPDFTESIDDCAEDQSVLSDITGIESRLNLPQVGRRPSGGRMFDFELLDDKATREGAGL